MKIYYYMTINYLKQKGIIPDEEMMAILSFFFGNSIFQERDNTKPDNNNNNINNDNNKNIIKENNEKDNKIKKNNNSNYELVCKTPFPIKFNYNFKSFIKYSFTNNGTFKQRKLIKAALNENVYSNIVINTPKKKLKPIVVVKIKDYIYTADFFPQLKS